ncbi:MAG: phosphate ABC transporter, permease protein PstA [Spirochaetaceae bacterium 4572_59]|nr:MAG: phosphate ABC transporter, permease protein PstA [Spirochaetaceae bacterium 4572_59]
MTGIDVLKNRRSNTVQSSPQSRKINRQEIIAKGIICFFTAFTIAILVWIVGYLMVKGFRYNNDVSYDVTTQIEREIPLDNTDEDVVFIINSKVRSEDIPVAGLRKLYNKARKENWGFYNQQNLKVVPFAYEGAGSFSDDVMNFILTGSDLETYRKNVSQTSSWEDMIHRVGQTPGALGFIPASKAEGLPKSVKVLSVRRISLIVSPSVLRIQDGRMMREISQADADKLFSGKVVNWKEIGGIDLPVTLVFWDSKDASSIINRDEPVLAKIQIVHSEEDFYSSIVNTNGAVALGHYSSIESEGLSFIPVLRHETGWNLTWHFIFESPARSGQWGGVSYIILNTFFLILFTIIFSTPVGIMAAIYLVEYTNQGRLMRILRMGTETLAGIPSIVFGLFGFIFFVQICGLGIGFISSTLTITLMVLPTIIRSSEEALKSVPQSFREGSLALGASKLQTIIKVVLPAASPGILTGIILAIGRTVGETAVLIYTLGSNYDLVTGPSSSARVLSLHLYMLFSEALSFDRTFATGAILVILVLITNLSTTWIVKGVNKNASV